MRLLDQGDKSRAGLVAAGVLALAMGVSGCGAGGSAASLGDTSGGGVGAAAPLEVDPDGVIEFSVQGSNVVFGGPYELTLSNPGGASLTWTAQADKPWVDLSQYAGTLVPAGAATVSVFLAPAGLVGLAPGVHEATIQFEDPVGGGNTNRTVRLDWAPGSAPLLTVEPLEAFEANGPVGGPFSPATKSYLVRNVGEVAASFTTSASPAWVAIDGPGAGTLQPGAQATVVARIQQAAAANLGAGLHEGLLVFVNTDAGHEVSVPVRLTAEAPSGNLTTATNSLAFSAQVGQGLPANQTVQVRNTGGSPVAWTASSNQGWFQVSPSSGTLNPGAATVLNVSLGASALTLAPGNHNGVLALVNTTNGAGSKNIAVSLQLAPAPATLATAPKTPAAFSVGANGPAVPSFQSYTLTNSGGSPLTWSASANQPWIGLSSSGGVLAPGAQATLAITVVSAATAGLPSGLSAGLVQVQNTSNGAGGDSISVTVSKGSQSPLAMNLEHIAYYSPELPFVDLFRMAGDWLPQEVNGYTWNTGQALAKDANGWIASLGPNQAASVLLARDIGGNYPAGIYTLLYDGVGSFQVQFDGKIVQVEPGRILVQVTPSNGGVLIKLVSTDPTNPARNIRFLMPGHEQTYQTEMWNPAFLEMIEPFSALRFMDWQRTNNSTISQWSQRATPATYSQATSAGISLEFMVRLANETGKDPWFCIPHLANNSYVTQFATYVRDNLDPARKIYVEFSNEVWNPMFSQAQWAQSQGQAQGWGGSSFENQLRFYSQRAVQVFDIWTNVFGNQSSRVVRTLAGQAVNPWTGTVIMDWQSAHTKADAYAIAPYFGNALGDPANQAQNAALSVDQMLDWCENNIIQQMNHVATNANNTNQRGLDLLAYEGGQHLVGYFGAENNTVLTAKFVEANRHPRMRDLYLDYLERWKNAGGKLFCHFNSVSNYGKWGSWGSLENLNQDKNQVPKYSALLTFIATTPAWW